MSTPLDVDTPQTVHHVISKLRAKLDPFGFELSPFLVGWYNELVSMKMRLDAPSPDCVALCLISSPLMFESSFLPLLLSWFEQENVRTLEDVLQNLRSQEALKVNLPGLNDPLDWSVFIRVSNILRCVQEEMKSILTEKEYKTVDSCRFIPDYNVRSVSRLPLVHVQSAGHVSGAAYYHRVNIKIKELNTTIGCSLHPKYGGWFGFRGVILFPNLRYPQLPRPVTRSSLPPGIPPFDTDALRTLVTEYREHWRENRWRSTGLDEFTELRYSTTACSFFNTPPALRAQWVERLIAGTKPMCSTQPVTPSTLIRDQLPLTHPA
ncbi:unnamed protein product [Echinostoma caproni]|uniref:Cyanocobalamin reductase (cyanide-eliminating) n=1 Tax=Echinostoma caproni TaxID=27848 RepID=A0A183ABW2_9TREM|nr:unnamed protein product [Echinostoma caproni]